MNWASAIPAALLATSALLLSAAQDGGAAPAVKPSTAARLDAASIDKMFEAAWAQAGVKPQASAPDGEWLRRASLVLNGTIPTAEEVDAFVKDTNTEKRARKVDELLTRPEYSEFFGGEWTRDLVGRDGRRNRFDRAALENWIIDQFGHNVPMNQFAERLLTASGPQEENPAAGFFLKYECNPKDVAAPVSKVFLGVDIQCARCHDHKYEQWKQHEFNEFAAYFANTVQQRYGDKDAKPPKFEVVETREQVLNGAGKRLIEKQLEKRAMNAKNPEAAQNMKERMDAKFATPTPLRPLEKGVFAEPLPSAAAPTEESAKPATRREALVQWMTSPGNPYFTRSIANRIFSQLFGYGVASPLDDFRSDTKLAIPGLLDALAMELEHSGYNMRDLVAMLAKTRAFGLESGNDKPTKADVMDAEQRIFARYVARPMGPEQLFDSVTRATGIDEAAENRARQMKQVGKRAAGKKGAGGDDVMTGEGAAKMYGRIRDQALKRFISTFEDDEQGESIDFEGTIPQALMMMNSKIVSESMRRGFTLTRVQEKASGNDKVDALYIAVLSRKPSSDERLKALGYLQKQGDKRETFEDLLWALLNSAEFSTIH